MSNWYSSMRERVESIDTGAGFHVVKHYRFKGIKGYFLYIDPLTFPSHLQWAIGKIIKNMS